MKKLLYIISEEDIEVFSKNIRKELGRQAALHEKFPAHPPKLTGEERMNNATRDAYYFAVFQQFVRDELAVIHCLDDDHYSFTDHCGDCFCPITNHDLDPKELARQKKNEYNRFKRHGAKFMQMEVMGEELDSIGGFIGNDFYGSGYDGYFYRSAYERIRQGMPDYFKMVYAMIPNTNLLYESDRLGLDSTGIVENNSLPKFVRNGTSHMKLVGEGYETRGWSLPVKNVEVLDGKFFIIGFMAHLDKTELIPITEAEFNEDQTPQEKEK